MTSFFKDFPCEFCQTHNLGVFNHACPNAAGHEANVPDRICGTAALIPNFNGEILLIDHKSLGGVGPGGKADPNEAWIECLDRELREEIGTALLAASLMFHEDQLTHYLYIFAALVNPRKVKQMERRIWWDDPKACLQSKRPNVYPPAVHLLNTLGFRRDDAHIGDAWAVSRARLPSPADHRFIEAFKKARQIDASTHG